MGFAEETAPTGKLVLVRHGESEFNAKNCFAGWVDTPLTATGIKQAQDAGQLLREAGFKPDIVYTSTLSRAIDTASNILKTLGIAHMPIIQKPELLERHYGGLTGMNKAEAEKTFGPEQFLKYRRSFSEPPPPMEISHPYHPNNPAEGIKVIALPPNGKGTEALADVVERVRPFWEKELLPRLQKGENILISAHGNSLRALTMIIKKMTPDQIIKYEMANAVPVTLEIKSPPGEATWTVVNEQIGAGQAPQKS